MLLETSAFDRVALLPPGISSPFSSTSTDESIKNQTVQRSIDPVKTFFR